MEDNSCPKPPPNSNRFRVEEIRQGEFDTQFRRTDELSREKWQSVSLVVKCAKSNPGGWSTDLEDIANCAIAEWYRAEKAWHERLVHMENWVAFKRGEWKP